MGKTRRKQCAAKQLKHRVVEHQQEPGNIPCVISRHNHVISDSMMADLKMNGDMDIIKSLVSSHRTFCMCPILLVSAKNNEQMQDIALIRSNSAMLRQLEQKDTANTRCVQIRIGECSSLVGTCQRRNRRRNTNEEEDKMPQNHQSHQQTGKLSLMTSG